MSKIMYCKRSFENSNTLNPFIEEQSGVFRRPDSSLMIHRQFLVVCRTDAFFSNVIICIHTLVKKLDKLTGPQDIKK